MKEIVLKVYKFDELSKDSQEKIIERERWNVMEQCMDAYSVDYKKSMKAFVFKEILNIREFDINFKKKNHDPE